MAPDVLNQEEVDSLLDLMNEVEESGDGGTEGDATGSRPRGGFNLLPSSEIHAYDFKRPERLSQEQGIALQALHESCARNLSAAFSAYLGTIVEVNLNAVEQVTHSEFPMSLPSPSSFNLVGAEPLDGDMVLEMNPSILFPMIDRLLGGSNAETQLLDRPFTAIELKLVESVLERVITQLNVTWENLGVRFSVIESAPNPFLLQVVAPNEPVVLVSFEVTMGEYTGMINMCIPFKLLEPVLPHFSQTSWLLGAAKASKHRQDAVLASIAPATVRLTAILAETDVSLGDLLDLRPGDIVDTGQPTGGHLVLAVDGRPKFHGVAGIHRDRRALRITSPIDSAGD